MIKIYINLLFVGELNLKMFSGETILQLVGLNGVSTNGFNVNSLKGEIKYSFENNFLGVVFLKYND